MLAASSGASPTIVAAIVTGVLIVLGGILTPVWSWMLNRRVGKPDPALNGSGTLNAQMTTVLVEVGTIKEKVNTIAETVDAHTAKLDHLDECLDAVKKRGER